MFDVETHRRSMFYVRCSTFMTFDVLRLRIEKALCLCVPASLDVGCRTWNVLRIMHYVRHKLKYP